MRVDVRHFGGGVERGVEGGVEGGVVAA